MSAKSRPHVQLIRAELPSNGSSEPPSESLSKLSSHQIPHSLGSEGSTTAKALYANSFFVLNHYAFGGVRAQALSVLVLSTSTTESSWRVLPPRGSRLAVPARDTLFVFLELARWSRTRRFHVRWIRCRRPVSGSGPLTLRLCLRLHFCRRLHAVGTCSRASGRVSRARSTPSLAIATHMSSSLKVSSTVTQSTGASGRVFPDATEYQFDFSVSKARTATLHQPVQISDRALALSEVVWSRGIVYGVAWSV